MADETPKSPVINDEYRLKARIWPALILLMPIAIPIGIAVGIATTNWLLVYRVVGGVVATLTTNIGLGMLVEQIIRNWGKRKEDVLWAGWGGAPTTRMLRHREMELSTPIRRQQINEKLKKLIPEIQIPTKAKEEKDQEAADGSYDECVRYLRNATRDEKKFPLIFKENINYGFARNLWAVKPIGVTLSIVSVVATSALMWSARKHHDPLWIADAGGLIIVILFLGMWLFVITPSWVFTPARAYAERLFDACDSLKPAKQASASKSARTKSIKEA